MKTQRLGILSMASLFPAMAIATPAAAAASPDLTGETLRVVLGLAAVVVMILLAGWVGRRAQSRVRPGGRRMRCVEALPVGAKDRVLLLEAGGRQLLVGVSAAGMRTLLVLDEPVDETPADDMPTTGFRDLLAQWRSRG